MDLECCLPLKELLEKNNTVFDEEDIPRFINYVLDPRPCRCQLQIEVPKENLGYLIEAFVKHAIQKIKDVANGCVAVSKDIKIASELDNVFQALTKLFQVHFYMTDRGKKLQSIAPIKHDYVWNYCDIANEEAPPQMLGNVAMFCEFGGLDAVSECFLSEQSVMPVSLASRLISIIAQIRVWLNMEAMRDHVRTLAAPVLRYLCSLSEDEIRMPNTRAVADLMLSTVKVETDNEPKIDRNALELSFIYFMSSTLTVRMEGLNQITNQIHHLIELSQNDSFGDIDSLCQELAKWLIEKEMIEHLFGPNHHIELLKQSQFLLNFLAQEKQLRPKHLECVWTAAQLKHTGKFVLDLLISLTKHMELKSIQFLLTLVGKLAIGSHTKQTLLLASLLIRRVWSATLSGSKREELERPKVVNVQVKKRVNVSPVVSDCNSASVSSDGSSDEEVERINDSIMTDSDTQGEDSQRQKKQGFPPVSLDYKMSSAEVPHLSSDDPLEVSPRDFEDSDDILPHSSFQSDPVEGEYDEDEIHYMNVSPVSERERDSEESEDDEVASLVNRLSNASPSKSPQKVDLDADKLCGEGQTLLWDLLQDKNIEELGDGMTQEVQKLLWQLVCYTGNRSVVMAFIKGCLNNIELNRSVVVSFQLLPKILNGYPMTNSNDGHWVLEWAVQDLKMMDVFFSNLKDSVDAWPENLSSAGENDNESRSREQQTVARLDFLTALYSNDLSPDHFRLTISQVDCLWSCLVTKIPARFHYLLLSWLLKQANSKDLHALGLDAFKHIFMNKLPEMNPETITFTGLSLFQQLFGLTRLSNASPFAQDSEDEKIPGIDYLWKIALKAQRDQVADEAMGYLNFLYITIGNGCLEKEKEFLGKCMMFLKTSMDNILEQKKDSIRIIQQILTILKSHLEAYWKRFAYHIHIWQLNGHNLEGHQPRIRSLGKEQLLRVICQPAGFSDKVTFRLSSYDLLAKLRAEVTHWCTQFQKEQDEKGEPQVTTPLQPPFRLISHGHELTPDLDHKALGELGIKDQQLVFVSMSHPRKDRSQNGSQAPSSLQQSPNMEASPMVQLLKEENFSLFFKLLDVLHKAKSTIDKPMLAEEEPSSGFEPVRRHRRELNDRKGSTTDDLVHSLWELLMILPTNMDIKRKLELLDTDEHSSSDSAWGHLLITDSMFKLLYVLHIIDSLSSYDHDVLQSVSQDDTSNDSDSSSSENEQAVLGMAEPLGWVKKFIKLGGMKHLYDRLFSESLSTESHSDDWTLDCVGCVLKLLTRFGCVSLSKEEKEDNGEREGKRRRVEFKQRKHVFRARYKSIEGDNVVVIQGFNQSLIELVKEEALLEKLITLLCRVSDCRNQYCSGSQDVHAAGQLSTQSLL